jgi:hypothetical protein
MRLHRRRARLLPAPDVHLGRHGERHRSVVADGVRGSLYVPLGSTPGAAITILLTETFASPSIPRQSAGTIWVCGTLLLLFVIFLPQGLLGSMRAMLTRMEVVRHE